MAAAVRTRVRPVSSASMTMPATPRHRQLAPPTRCGLLRAAASPSSVQSSRVDLWSSRVQGRLAGPGSCCQGGPAGPGGAVMGDLGLPSSPRTTLGVRDASVPDRPDDDPAPRLASLDGVQDPVAPNSARPESSKPSSQLRAQALRVGFEERQGLVDGLLYEPRKRLQILLRPTGEEDLTQARVLVSLRRIG